MKYQLIDGKATATTIKSEISEEVQRIVAAGENNHISQQFLLVMTEEVRLI